MCMCMLYAYIHMLHMCMHMWGARRLEALLPLTGGVVVEAGGTECDLITNTDNNTGS